VQKLACLRRVKLGRIWREERKKLLDGLPLFVWALDAVTAEPSA